MKSDSISIKLQELFDLLKSGALSQEEYDLLKSRIINQDSEEELSNINIGKEPQISQSTESNKPIDIETLVNENINSPSEKLVTTKKSKKLWLIMLVVVALAIISLIVNRTLFFSNKSTKLYKIGNDTISANLLPPVGLYERDNGNGKKVYINIIDKDGAMIIQTGDVLNMLENMEDSEVVKLGQDTTTTIIGLTGLMWTIQYKGFGKLEEIVSGATIEGVPEEYIKVK